MGGAGDKRGAGGDLTAAEGGPAFGTMGDPSMFFVLNNLD